MFPFKAFSKICLSIAGSFALASVSHGQAVTFVGSVGTPEVASGVPHVETYGRGATVSSGSSAGVARLRYNIVPTPDLTRYSNTSLLVNFKDSGSSTRVIVKLYETDLYANNVIERMRFDSDWSAPSTSWQTHVALSTFDFSFTTKAYYLEVELHKANNNPNVWIAGLQMYRY